MRTTNPAKCFFIYKPKIKEQEKVRFPSRMLWTKTMPMLASWQYINTRGSTMKPLWRTPQSICFSDYATGLVCFSRVIPHHYSHTSVNCSHFPMITLWQYNSISFILCSKQEFRLLDLADARAEPSLLLLATEAQLCCFTKHFHMPFLLTRSVNGTFPRQSLHFLDHNKIH